MASIRDQLVTTLVTDGVDHVNLSAYGDTEVGRISSPDWRRKFYIPYVGDFVSARSFANWLVSGGNESLRHSSEFYKTNVPLRDFRALVLFAKYYQLCGMRSYLLSGSELVNLPWQMYKKYSSGIHEHDRWTTYPESIKTLVKAIIARESKGRHDVIHFFPDTLNCVNYYLKAITGDAFVPFEDLDKITKKPSENKAKNKNNLTARPLEDAVQYGEAEQEEKVSEAVTSETEQTSVDDCEKVEDKTEPVSVEEPTDEANTSDQQLNQGN